MHADVLIVTVTKVESMAVLDVFQEATGQQHKLTSIGDGFYYDLGDLNGARVFMVQSEMGAVGLGASQQTVQKGINALSPSAIIMAGIAFGVNDEKQHIGDILISKQLMLYEPQRVSTRKGRRRDIPRGARADASRWLLALFRAADSLWKGPTIHFGLVLSGEKLVDNLALRQKLLNMEPEAIGGEMEGAGLYVACQDSKVDWILVKAICDWADGNKAQDKDERQRLAAHHAASFVLHALQQAPLKIPKEHIHSTRDLLPALQIKPRAEASSRSSLPRQAYFFGREKELGIIADALLPESRSWGVLIDGPGGIGKSSLAIQAGHVAPDELFPLKIFLSAKVRELTPSGEQPLQDFMLPNFIALLTELAAEVGLENISRLPPDDRANVVRRSLTDKQALIIIDNVETFNEQERVRLYQFLGRLPGGCKAIVTSRRRTDIDARIVRLDRLALKDALDLMTELAKSNRQLDRSSDKERQDLYEITGGNPLLIRWVIGQLGREGSHCRTIPEACEFMKSAPKDNDPLEYIFGDLLDTFTESETAVLAALTYFTQPAKVEWIAEMANLPQPVAQTALEDLADRALLVSDEQAHLFFLSTLAGTFLRRRHPEIVARTGNRLVSIVYALAMENGYQNYERFPQLEVEWPRIAAALPLFLQSENTRLHSLCDALDSFMNFSGRWDEWLSFLLDAEDNALAASDFYNAGDHAYYAGWIYCLRGQAADVSACATRCEDYWQKGGTKVGQNARSLNLRALGYKLEKNYPAAIAAFKEALTLYRTLKGESGGIASILNSLAAVEHASRDYSSAEIHYREALKIVKKINNREGVASCIGNLAELAFDRQEWHAAEALAREALELAEAVGRVELIGSDCYLLARSLVQQDRPQEALRYAQRAVEINSKLRMPDELEEARAVLIECEAKI